MSDCSNNSDITQDESNVRACVSVSEAVVQSVAEFLQNEACENVRVYQMSEVYDYVDYCIIATTRSQVHRRGVVQKLPEFFTEREMDEYARWCTTKTRAHKEAAGWLLLDLYDMILHLMDDETRTFYNLEKLWFNAPCVFDTVANPR